MATQPFVHLHVHSHYSMLDGACRVDDLTASAAEMGMPAVALTDHGNLFGVVDFYRSAQSAGVRPIVGIEAYISPTTRTDRDMRKQSEACYHLVLLAMNETGYRNLLKLSSLSYLEGFYYKPRVDRELLSQYGEGLICTTACLGGEIPQALLRGQYDQARRIAGEYKDLFGPERLFIEVQVQGIAEQDRINPDLVRLADEMGLGIVGTNDVHFLQRKDKQSHEVLTCISTGKTLADGAMEYPPELYFKSAEEMRAALKDFPTAADNTLKIAEMCQLDLDFSAKHLPVYHTPAGESAEDHLDALAWKGLCQRLKVDDRSEIPDDYRTRMEWELKVIKDKGYSSYFLIVNDFVQFARAREIPAAPRGSGVATLLGYALGIANVDPLTYGLLFERFTDPARQEDPDIDIDMCQEGRAEVLEYVREKYGHVAQVITYGTLKAKAAVRDVGRVMGLPLPDVDQVAKLIPDGPKVKLGKAVEEDPDLGAKYREDTTVHQLIDHAKTLEGLARHSGVHACAVVICEEPLEQYVPLCRQADSEDVITQWDGPTCESAAGLMKMDFLGLRTLTILKRCRELVRENTGTDVDPEQLPLDDPEVFKVFQQAQTDGVFQFESDGMKNVLLQMQPDCIQDVIAANAMYRPGPMELIPAYCNRKHGREEVPSVHPLVDDILAETYGIMTYQEQVMQVLNRLGKLPLNRALTLIKAISKKKEKVISAEKPNFITGAGDNGIGEAEAENLFGLIQKFAGYGFNKAHSTRYAIVAYQTAYFKRYHPQEFIAATLTYECGDTDKVVQYMGEARRLGVEIAAPDVNLCGKTFTVDGDRVRFGLSAVKGVGDKAVDAIIAAREELGRFKDLYDFCEHVDLRAVNRSTIEALIKCGALDAMGASRASMSAALDGAIRWGQQAADDRKSGQMNLFGGGAGASAPPRPDFPDVEPWSESQLLQAEKETLGFYITSHPLVKHARELRTLSAPAGIDLTKVHDAPHGSAVSIGCTLASVRTTLVKNGRSAGRKMAMLTLEDVTGKCDAVVFSDVYEQSAEVLEADAMLFVDGTVDRSRDRMSIKVDRVIPIESAIEQLTAKVVLRLPPEETSSVLLEELRELLARHAGRAPVSLDVRPLCRPDAMVRLQVDSKWSVRPSQKLLDELTALLGDRGGPTLLRKTLQVDRPTNGFRRRRPPAAAAKGPASEAVTRFN